MLDSYLQPLTYRPLARVAAFLGRRGVKANTVTVTGFAIGMLAVPLLAWHCYQAALLAIALNRLCDGLDGALARQQGLRDSGGFLDITLDFIFYASVVLGFALASPADNALAAATLLTSFMGTAASFLAFAVMAGKRGLTQQHRYKSLYYLGGLTEGSETMALFMLMCLWPEWFAPLAYGFALLCLLTTISRVVSGYHTLRCAEDAPNSILD